MFSNFKQEIKSISIGSKWMMLQRTNGQIYMLKDPEKLAEKV